jgi:hypothetical protein
MLLLYILLLGALAAFTAYTRNFQSTVIGLGHQIPTADASLMPWRQGARTIALVIAWPAAIGLGMVFVAWWKAVMLVVGAFLILVPLTGSFTPRPMSAHYLGRIRADLAKRISRSAKNGRRDAAKLQAILEQLEALSPNRRQSPPHHPT